MIQRAGEHSARQETPSAGSVTFPGPRGSLISLPKCLKCENSKEEQEFLILVPNVLLAILRRNRKWKKRKKTVSADTTPTELPVSALHTHHHPGLLAILSFLSNSSILCSNFLPAILELFKFFFCSSFVRT